MAEPAIARATATNRHPLRANMQNLLNDLTRTLERDERLTVDGTVLKNKVVELALSMDKDLLALLLSEPSIRKHFFSDINGTLVFDKDSFQRFISNKQFLPDSYTSYKNKVGLASDDEFTADTNKVVLVWPYKDCILEGGQDKDDAKRTEIFWNETLAPDRIDRLLSPKVLSDFKRFDDKSQHKPASVSIDDNLILKGNNLLALHTL